MRLAKYIVASIIAFTQLGAHQDSVPKFQSFEVHIDVGKVFVAELLPQHDEESRESIRLEFIGVLVCRGAQSLKSVHRHRHNLHRSTKYAGRVLEKAPEALALSFYR